MTAKTKQWLAFFGGIALSLALLGVFTTFNRSRPPGALAPLPAPSAPGTASRSALELSSAQASSIKLQVASVTLQELVENLPVAATVVPDESRISHVHTRVAGWVEKLHVANTGQFVRAGQPLVDIFSQELLASQLE